ncbi:putative cytochrome P450 monooxygenase [Westerdykella ornata]|uniref:Putative cytochrome P450 monooxygenase n=1 Tax=Westerdykella ornata TaxID=318751 RepID=A0A6A6JK61_WESOR|nr:putative cytochrome P450 monooxygenase [Westerdykella ornata]KAF2276644.1 putative cytochrome P450 monooxygenase [Westerdykella ornata]
MASTYFVTLAFCAALCALLGFTAKLRERLYSITVQVLSSVINAYLLWAHPIRSSNGSQSIPTCPYQWPNGQGDVAKFLEGEKNSERWSKKYGGVYRIWNGMTPEVVVSHPEDIQTVFKDSDKHRKAINNNAGWLMGELLGKCVGLISGEDWQRLRSVTNPPFTHKSSTHYIPAIIRMVDEEFRSLQETTNLKRGLINPVADLRYIPFWIIAEIIYGKLNTEQRRELMDIVPLREELFKRMIQGGTTRLAWSRYLPLRINRDLREFKNRWTAFNTKLCISQKSNGSSAPIVEMYDAMERGEVNQEELLQTLDEMLFANLDVTMGGLSWNLMFLASNAEAQDDIRKEIPLLNDMHHDGTSWEEYIKDPSTLLAASVLESARLKPLAAFSVPQSAPTARTVGGFVIPPGTNFMVDTHSLNIHNPFWGDDRELYRPSRFLDRKPSEIRYHYWRFGFGPRQCMGKYVVDFLIRAILAHLLANYQLSLHEDSRWTKNPETWISHPDTKIRCERLTANT